MVIAAVRSLSIGPSNPQLCHADGFCWSTSYGVTNSWVKSHPDSCRPYDPFSISTRNSFLGSSQSQWSSMGRDSFSFKVSVAADYPDSVPNSSDYTSYRSYHPLEEVNVEKCIRKTQLLAAETAKTAVHANSTALVVFPGSVHCEPHEQITWTECDYVIDCYGDIFFEDFDGQNILEDPEASNPVVRTDLTLNIYPWL
ncbi:hypothetical protein Tsubulata_038994 [Turnera subulata]|uniref:Uncharacterized protein n=1 Tax=Turnera subulata TaxID=218843 RepID=A0A9Q0JBR2_9ROSI|nr:hypothetical protein Tsubulata_038994 [Turnera subulata]